MEKEAYVYFMANHSNTVVYVGVTNNLLRRVAEHKAKVNSGFTDKYNCTKLVYFECSDYMIGAIEREKQIKNWKRSWKNDLIETMNPNWNDLSEKIGLKPEMVQEIAGQARNDEHE